MVTITATPTSPTPASYTSLDDFKDTVLSVSNNYRNEHDSCTLKWNNTLADYSRNWAQRCEWQHSNGPYGENLAFGYPNASTAIAAWGDERTSYDFKLPTGFSEETGHFTQLVWKATTQVGCAAVDCGYDGDAKDEKGGYKKAQGWYVVCEYAPAGNVMGKEKEWFRMNVVPEKARGGGGSSGSSGDGDGDGEKDNGAGRGYVGKAGLWLIMVHGVFFML